jgi:hypothetical protein
MKIFKVLLVVAIALGMMACNNEQDVPEISGEKDASISIKVVPSSDSPSFRAVGNLSGNGITGQGLEAESAIHQLEVWVFSGDVLTGYGSAQGNEVTEVTNVEAIAGESSVVVVANANIGIKVSKADLLDEVKGLPTDISTNGLIMTAEPIDVTLNAGNNYYGYTEAEVTAEVGEAKTTLSDTPLAITRVNARVAIVSAVLDYDSVPETQRAVFTHLGDIEVAMFNVPNKTKLFGDSLATNDDFQFGADWPSPEYSYVGVGTGTQNSDLHDSIAGLPISAESAPYYYVNENNSSVETGNKNAPAQKMFIVLRAKVYNDAGVVTSLEGLYTDGEGYTYYPVWVNKDGISAPSGSIGDGKVYRNTQYNISLTIKGLGNPSIDDVDKAFLDVKVKVAPWNVVTQNVVW